MCGIAGILGIQPENKQRMDVMLIQQKHRGPDAKAIWRDDKITLGHNRLSIIDLTTNSNQPMVSNCGNFVIVFNGEIYNYLEIKQQLVDCYSFKTTSDTEVLLAAYIIWGKKMLDKLNGMFSFAIWNKKENLLFAARDRFGVKPFYYTVFNDQLYFASEIKTLFATAIPKKDNKKVWANYYSFGTYGLPNETFFEDIHQLPGGHYLEIHFLNNRVDKKITTQKWYHFIERIAQIKQYAKEELRQAYKELLIDSIKLRFRADVPLGMNVSGGLDSSTLISLVHQNLPTNKTIEAFTFYSNDENYDELPWVNQLIEQTPYHLNKVLLQYDKIPNLIEEISFFQDEPYGGFPTLAYSLLFKNAKNKGVKVILDGQGIDEALAGYDYYHNKSNNVIQGTTSAPVRPSAIDVDFINYAEKENYDMPFDNALQNMQYRDLFYTKIPRALRFNDRISMMHSTELREPFLDYRLVELGFAQPKEMKLQNGQTKWLLRDLIQNQLGSSIALAPKRALQTPQREWIANELLDYCEDKISAFSNLDFTNKKEVQQIWQEYKKGNQNNSFYIWQWINTVALKNH